MLSVFDLKKLSSLLRDFYEISHIRITVFDETMRELAAYPKEAPPLCKLIRSISQGLDACTECDREACAIASKKGGTHIYRCHAGLTEAITPLYVDDILVGYLFFGNVFSYPTVEEGVVEVIDCCKSFPIDPLKLKQACLERPLLSRSYVYSATQILHAVASYLIMERIATLQEEKKAVRLNAYISAHFTEPLTSETLCRQLSIGRTQLYELSDQLYGCGAAQHIRALRMEKAKMMLLENPPIPIAEIATACGYSDYNYFITVFSREVGCSPKAYRKKTSI